LLLLMMMMSLLCLMMAATDTQVMSVKQRCSRDDCSS
jgi:hypothetical protein